MASGSSESPNDSYFNDLSQQPVQEPNNDARSSPVGNGSTQEGGQKEADAANKPKRIACVLCRKRKLRCDGARPTCGTCKRLAHDCAYDEVRKKSGPKRGYVKLLEARLQQVETLLKNQETGEQNKDPSRSNSSPYVANTIQQSINDTFLGANEQVPFGGSISPGGDAFQNNGSANAHTADGEFPWEMIGLGLDEPLPPQDVINDLYQLYFTKVHPSLPIIHRPRFMAAMNLAPHMRPPVCLRYIMWTLAASITDKYDALQEHFYHRARKYAQMDEMKGHGESTITLAHCQTWILMGTYEFKQMYFPRAWLSAGRAVRLAQMMQLHRLDGIGLDVKQCLPPPKDWTEREERRRTFWMAFCIDRYASIGTGWPMTIDERDVLTNLPSSEEAFEKSKPMPTGSLEQALGPGGAGQLNPLGAIVLTAALFGRNLLHLHRPGADDRDDDINGGFWTRHRDIENILLNTSLGLPDQLRLPTGLPDPNVVYANMSIHTSAICLHQAAIFKADKYRLPVSVSNESKIRCVTAAAEIASIMRMISHLDLASMNPFISFCVYVAARVFVQYLKTRPKDQQMTSSLQFLLQAMQALRRKNPLTESFLVQLDLDLESAGILGLQKSQSAFNPSPTGPAEIPVNTDSVRCAPMFALRESQGANASVNTYGNGNPSLPNNSNQFPSTSPGGPFHVSSSLSMESQPNYSFATTQQQEISAQQDIQMELRTRPKPSTGGIETHGNDAEMDTSPDVQDHPTPSTLNSRGGSTSHTSYSPSQSFEEPKPRQYRPSPKSTTSMSQNQTTFPQSSTSDSTSFFPSTSEDMFATGFYASNVPPDQADPATGGFLMNNDWDLSAGLGGGAGMTPMSEGSWNQMLESINLGWETLGPPHGPGPHI